MVSFRERQGLFLRPRLKRLQEMQGEIYRQLLLLIPDQVSLYDSFQSRVSGYPLLRMDVLERHPYTHFLRLTYEFEESHQGRISPDAHIRMYQDARLAEVTSFDPEQGFRRLAHPWYPQRPLLQRTWRLNLALDKWLGYLLHQGHSMVTMAPADAKIGTKRTRSAVEAASAI